MILSHIHSYLAESRFQLSTAKGIAVDKFLDKRGLALVLSIAMCIVAFGCGMSSTNAKTAVAPPRFTLEQIRVDGKTMDLSASIKFEKGIEYSMVFGLKNRGMAADVKSGVIRMVREGVIIQSATFALKKAESSSFSIPFKIRIPKDAKDGKVSLTLKDDVGLIVEVAGEVQ